LVTSCKPLEGDAAMIAKPPMMQADRALLRSLLVYAARAP
jgi:hypothetical protein